MIFSIFPLSFIYNFLKIQKAFYYDNIFEKNCKPCRIFFYIFLAIYQMKRENFPKKPNKSMLLPYQGLPFLCKQENNLLTLLLLFSMDFLFL
ncbi:hypothetical protein HMPREF9389_0131 [Streptococcus sanguinis SK355]|uniref:Uncharacterized protein n=1 Tax=Streptococcus sanguinis SK355 TaxID=888816 RepID=F3UMS3_STRSA|nr:hypothetical protein HMPREF9389_0131 [Streptococcus sanguinis SK355]